MKNVKKIAIFALATLFIVTTLFTALVCFLHKPDLPSAKSEVELELPVIYESQETEDVLEKEVTPETKVLLVDASGSMKNNIFASAGYDTVQKFGDFIGQAGGDSYICTNITRALDMGVKYLGVVTDLESYPTNEKDSLNGKKYENVSLTFYLPENVNPNYVSDYQKNWSNALEQSNSTLVFVNSDGSKLVVFDNYGKVIEEDTTEETEEAKEDSKIAVKVNTEANLGDSISFKTLVLILGTIIDLFCIFGIILIALIYHSEKSDKGKDVPDDIKDAFKLPVALDGSGSVSNEYNSMVKYAEKLKVGSVWRFADEVNTISIDKAKNTPAGGNTSGWKCLKEMADAGLREIAIMTDFDFNDSEDQAASISFEHITMIIPANVKVNDEIKQKVIKMCKSYKEVVL